MTLTPARRIITALILAVAAILATAAQAGAADKVGICHATNSGTNPYVYIEVAQAAAQAHLDGTHPSHHGPTADDEDYLAEDPSECATPVNPSTAPTPSPSPSTTPTASPTSSATPTPETSATATTRATVITPDLVTELPDTAYESDGLTWGLLLMGIGGLIFVIAVVTLIAESLAKRRG